jgi:PncC family amidohydrolase
VPDWSLGGVWAAGELKKPGIELSGNLVEGRKSAIICWEESMVIEVEVGALLRDRGLTLATAESSTGGLVAHRITRVSGSSSYYLGGFVTYANEAKEALVGVRHETLLAHGAVSEETAQEMACGARERLGADLGIATTGIAGPTGGTPEKPVGLVYVALSAADVQLCERHVWQGDRMANNQQSAEAALQLVRSYVQGQGG